MVRVYALSGLRNGQTLPVFPNDLAPLRVHVGFLQERGHEIERIDAQLVRLRIGGHPVVETLDGHAIEGWRLLLVRPFSHARKDTASQGLRASLVFRRLCSMPRATHWVVKDLKRL